MANTNNVTSWSFSRYSDYKKCPLMFLLKHIKKIAEPKNDAMLRGNAVHASAEGFIKGTLKKLPPELELFADEFKKLKLLYKKKSIGMVVEDNWAFTNQWDRTEWNNWIRCWVRIKLDCAHQETPECMIVTDWKTGKFREELHQEYLEQLELYALAALVLHPHLEEVRPRLVYTDQGQVYPHVNDPLIYTQKDVKKLKTTWERRVKPMFADRIFAPKANDKCKWCWFGQSGKAKGGPGICKF